MPDGRATPLPDFAFRPGDTIVFGSEGRGIGSEVLSLCDERVTIPQRGVTDSLNLAVSVGIFLFEFFWQAPSSLEIPHKLRRHLDLRSSASAPRSTRSGCFVRLAVRKTRQASGSGLSLRPARPGAPTHRATSPVG